MGDGRCIVRQDELVEVRKRLDASEVDFNDHVWSVFMQESLKK